MKHAICIETDTVGKGKKKPWDCGNAGERRTNVADLEFFLTFRVKMICQFFEGAAQPQDVADGMHQECNPKNKFISRQTRRNLHGFRILYTEVTTLQDVIKMLLQLGPANSTFQG